MTRHLSALTLALHLAACTSGRSPALRSLCGQVFDREACHRRANVRLTQVDTGVQRNVRADTNGQWWRIPRTRQLGDAISMEDSRPTATGARSAARRTGSAEAPPDRVAHRHRAVAKGASNEDRTHRCRVRGEPRHSVPLECRKGVWPQVVFVPSTNGGTGSSRAAIARSGADLAAYSMVFTALPWNSAAREQARRSASKGTHSRAATRHLPRRRAAPNLLGFDAWVR